MLQFIPKDIHAHHFQVYLSPSMGSTTYRDYFIQCLTNGMKSKQKEEIRRRRDNTYCSICCRSTIRRRIRVPGSRLICWDTFIIILRSALICSVKPAPSHPTVLSNVTSNICTDCVVRKGSNQQFYIFYRRKNVTFFKIVACIKFRQNE